LEKKKRFAGMPTTSTQLHGPTIPTTFS